jgi:hypothetical protein
MNIQDWGAIGEIVGAIATVVTLAYLAVQIRNATKEQKRQALIGFVDRLIDRRSYLLEDPSLRKIDMKGRASYQSLNEDEKLQFGFLMMRLLATMESYVEYAESGDLKKETARAMKRGIVQTFASPGVLEWWEEDGRDRFAEDFVTFVGKTVREGTT